MVRWSFVPPGTPFVPYLSNWVSANWDPDPKPGYYLGEQRELGRTYSLGSPAVPVGEVCGTVEQWRSGQALPPARPVLRFWTGQPYCCGRQPDDRMIWLRPEELTTYSEGDPLTDWPRVPLTLSDGDQVIVAQQPTYHIDPATGYGGSRFRSRNLFPSVFQGLELDVPFTAAADFSVFVVCKTETAVVKGFIVGNVGAGTLSPILKSGGFFCDFGVGLVGVPFALTTGTFAVWSCVRLAGTVKFRKNTALLGTFPGNPTPVDFVNFSAGRSGFADAGGTCWCPELLIFKRALADNDVQLCIQYLRDKYAIA